VYAREIPRQTVSLKAQCRAHKDGVACPGLRPTPAGSEHSSCQIPETNGSLRLLYYNHIYLIINMIGKRNPDRFLVCVAGLVPRNQST
jgi:hypothetical protein